MKLKAALLTVSVAVGFHIYLALHYYGLNFGLLTGESICNINSVFNCDTVTASSFSAIFGIPIALWGAVTNSVLALLLMGWILGWADDLARHGRYILWLAGLIAAVSVVMGIISTFMVGSFCLFCIGTYLCSFIAFLLILFSQETTARPTSEYISELASSGKTFLFFLLAIPLGTAFFHYSYTSSVGAGELDAAVRNSVADWKVATPVDLSQTPPAIAKGSDSPKMTIEEFADFRCVHCKHAGPSIKAFINSHHDVKLKFYTFPLDGSCNQFMEGGGDGVSCFLAKSVYCAEKITQKGWALHDYIYATQEKINQGGMEIAKTEVAGELEKLQVPLEPQKACVESTDTDTAIRAQAQAGKTAGLKGTPLFIINGRRLDRGQLLPVLEGVYREL